MTLWARLLPLTITVMLLMLGLKSVAVLSALNPTLKLPAAQFVVAASAQSAPAEPPGPGPASNPPATPPLAAPPISDTERTILLQLRQRRQQLDAREAQLAAREGLLAASEHRLEARLNELTALQSKLQALEDARRQRDDANWAGLVKLYESMKPRDAAGIFDGLDLDVLVPVVDRMKESKAALIMAAMDPAKARILTTSIAQLRLRANSIAGNPAAANKGG